MKSAKFSMMTNIILVLVLILVLMLALFKPIRNTALHTLASFETFLEDVGLLTKVPVFRLSLKEPAQVIDDQFSTVYAAIDPPENHARIDSKDNTKLFVKDRARQNKITGNRVRVFFDEKVPDLDIMIYSCAANKFCLQKNNFDPMSVETEFILTPFNNKKEWVISGFKKDYFYVVELLNPQINPNSNAITFSVVSERFDVLDK